MLKNTKPFVDSGQLKVITVSHDSDETYPELKAAIRKHSIKYPVIYDGGIYDPDDGGKPIPACEWGVTGIPSSFLINPQGVIVANSFSMDDLGGLLDLYLNQGQPITGLSAYARINDDKSVSIFANVMNTSHEPVELLVFAFMVNWVWDENYVLLDETIFNDEIGQRGVVTFDEFNETTFEFVLPPDSEMDQFRFWVNAKVPGTDHLGSEKWPGIYMIAATNTIFLIDLEYNEETEEFYLVPLEEEDL